MNIYKFNTWFFENKFLMVRVLRGTDIWGMSIAETTTSSEPSWVQVLHFSATYAASGRICLPMDEQAEFECKRLHIQAGKA